MAKATVVGGASRGISSGGYVAITRPFSSHPNETKGNANIVRKSFRISRALRVAAVITIGAVLGVAATVATASAQQAPATSKPTAADEAAVRQLLDEINEAWEQGDATAYASLHTPDADLIDFRGTHLVGRQAIIDFFQPLFDGVLKDTRVEARITDFRFLSPKVAIFHTEGQIVPTGERSVQTFVATKGSDTTKGSKGWLIAAFQNTRIQPEL